MKLIKISKSLFFLKQVKKMLPLDSLKPLYYALIFPHLSYGIIAWGSADKGLIRPTDLLQKRAICTIHNAFYNSHTDSKFRKSKLLKIHDIFEYQSLLFTYDYLNNKFPSSFDGKFPQNRDVLNHTPDIINIHKCHICTHERSYGTTLVTGYI